MFFGLDLSYAKQIYELRPRIIVMKITDGILFDSNFSFFFLSSFEFKTWIVPLSYAYAIEMNKLCAQIKSIQLCYRLLVAAL